MSRAPVLELKPQGLYCEAGDFFIDPWHPVDRAIITHGHSDHARWGHRSYLCSPNSKPILKARLGAEISVQTQPFGEPITIGSATVSLHPAGHILGSAQVRVEVDGEVWVFTGDYKTEADQTSEPYETVRCHTFITETTFGLPIYHWKPESQIFEEINAWWRSNQAKGKASLLLGYSLGKAQRLLSGVDPNIGPIFVHGSCVTLNDIYRRAGINLPQTLQPHSVGKDFDFTQAIIVAPPSVQGTPWLRRFGEVSTAFASGWMTVRGNKRRRGIEQGFALSDHVDWPSLLTAVKDTRAERVLTTHGYSDASSRYFRSVGLDSYPLSTKFGEEEEEEPVETLS